MIRTPPSLRARVPPTRRDGRAQSRGDRTRTVIIEETIRCVVDEGFAAASARHIAERAGVTWGVVQYHFGDRNGILAEVVASAYDDFRVAIEGVDVPPGTPGQRIAAVVDAAWEAFSTPASRASLEILVATRATRDSEQGTELEEMARDMHRLGEWLVGDDPDPPDRGRAIGQLLWATLRGLVMAQMVTRRPLDSHVERALLADLITVALRAEPGGGPVAGRRGGVGAAPVGTIG